MKNLSRFQKILVLSVSYILVACLASVATYVLFIGDSGDGMAKLRQISKLIDTRFVGQPDEEAMYDAAAAAMVEGTGDRWSYYISASEMESYHQQKNNAYVGVGITISQREDGQGADILQVEPGGSAKEEGVLPGDILYKVEEKLVSELGIDGTGDVIRGEEGTSVKITVVRQEQELEFTLSRNCMQVAVAQGQMLENQIGYIRISNFNANCAKETIAWVDKLLEQGATALIFDVRYNGGGYVTQLCELLDYLLPEGKLFISEDYKGKVEVTESDADCIQVPMAVLVNGSSYSAAEFFAAALREYEWATVVGLPTTGKGYFQSTFSLADGSAVALSVGKYYTPNGVSLADEGGLIPDITVEVDDQTAAGIYAQTLAPEEDPQLQAAVEAFSS